VPSATRSGLSGAGLGTQNSDGVAMLEDAALDMMPDETTDMFSKRRVMHWDRRKKKFVQVCCAAACCAHMRRTPPTLLLPILQISAKESSDAHVTGKRIRNESGAVVTKTKQAHGEMYKKWQKSSKRRVEAVGGEETVSGPMSASMDWRAGKRLRGSRALAAAVGSVAPAGPAGFVERRRGGPDAAQELKTKHEVVKQRKTKLKEKRRLAGGARREDAPPKSAKGGDHKGGKFGVGKKGFGGAKRGRK
jgi:hypothetical protein